VKSEETSADPDFTARACASTYRIAAGMWIMLFLPALYFVLRHGSNAWPLLTVVGLTFAFVFYWVRSFEISISGNTLSYRSFLGRTRMLRLNEIEKAEIRIDADTRPVWKLILWTEPTSQKEAIVINMKVFSKADLNRVFDFLGPKLKERRFTMTAEEREAMMRHSV
jgi:hypothetical protein